MRLIIFTLSERNLTFTWHRDLLFFDRQDAPPLMKGALRYQNEAMVPPHGRLGSTPALHALAQRHKAARTKFFERLVLDEAEIELRLVHVLRIDSDQSTAFQTVFQAII